MNDEQKPSRGPAMSTPWTPGPWEAADNHGCRSIWSVATGQRVVTAFTDGLANDPVDAANVRLIIAAPAMAELLEQFCAPGAAEDGRLSLGEILTRAQALLTTAPSLLSRVKGETT